MDHEPVDQHASQRTCWHLAGAGSESSERDRTQMRAALERIQAVVADALA